MKGQGRHASAVVRTTWGGLVRPPYQHREAAGDGSVQQGLLIGNGQDFAYSDSELYSMATHSHVGQYAT
ncbi:MAG: hypothetical protein ACE5H4_15150 [Candidatus Thorarchaeota archaeon]